MATNKITSAILYKTKPDEHQIMVNTVNKRCDQGKLKFTLNTSVLHILLKHIDKRGDGQTLNNNSYQTNKDKESREISFHSKTRK